MTLFFYYSNLERQSESLVLTLRKEGDSPALCLHFLLVTLSKPSPLCSLSLLVYRALLYHTLLKADTQMGFSSSNKSAGMGAGINGVLLFSTVNSAFSFSIFSLELELLLWNENSWSSIISSSAHWGLATYCRTKNIMKLNVLHIRTWPK